MQPLLPALVVLAYGLVLVAIARSVDRAGLPPRLGRFVYPLSIAVYFTSWSFFGAVGTAAASGWSYLAIYLGPALVFLLGGRLLQRIAEQVRSARALSIGEFLAHCHGRSRSVAALVAILALLASIPYIALQLRAVAGSFAALVGLERSATVAVLTALALTAFAIAFGARSIEVARRNSGLLAAISIESVAKLAALTVLGGFALVLLARTPDAPAAGIAAMVSKLAQPPDASFLAATLAAALAMLCLPRQFYVGFVEAPDPGAPVRARWPFIAMLALVSVLALPLAAAGLALLGPTVAPDLYVLALPIEAAAQPLALLAFLGGFSAATAMVVVEALALSTMATNDLLAPLLLRGAAARGRHDLGRRMRRARRTVIAGIMMAAVIYGEALSGSPSLGTIGLVAFAGVAQFAPALILGATGLLSSASAVRAGLAAGGLTWLVLLFIPMLGTSLPLGGAGQLAAPGSLPADFATGFLTSLAVNLAAILLSVLLGRLPRAVRFAVRPEASRARTLGDLRALAARFVSEAEVEAALGPDLGQPDDPVTPVAVRRAEELIARVIGAPSARLVLAPAVHGEGLDLPGIMRLLDASGQSVTLSRSLLSATLEAIDQGVSVIDSNLRLVAWNRRYLELFDYPPGLVVIGRPVAELIRFNAERGECGPGEVEAHVARRLWHLSRRLPHSFERQRPSGRWIRTTGAAIPGGGYVMSFTDITTEKRAQAELERQVAQRTADLAAANLALACAKSAAEAATRDKTRFLAAASHDLQQPLHAARLFAAALEPELPEALRPLAANIIGSLHSAQALLRALLDVSRLDAGGIRPDPSRWNVRDLAEELERDFRPVACERGLDLVVRVRPALVETDRALVAAVLRNLLSNAVRYTAAGRVMLAARPQGRLLRLEVRDSGPGIAPEDQQRIFREFERAGHAGSEPGAGLGLAIVERIVRLLDARLTLRSLPGRGSTFAIAVPLAAAIEPAPGPAACLPGPDLAPRPRAGLCVLCLDDDPAALAATSVLLERSGLCVRTAASFRAAVALLGSMQVEAAVLDLDLGRGASGLTIALQLRNRDRTMPIVILTASPDRVPPAQRHALGLAVLAKPADPAQLLAALASRAGDGASMAA